MKKNRLNEGFKIADRCQILVSLFLIQLLYTILYEVKDKNFFLSPNQFVSILFGSSIILLLIKDNKLFSIIFNPIALLAAIPPLAMGLVCWIYHNYPLVEPSLISFMARFYIIGLFCFLGARSNPFLPMFLLKLINIFLLFTTLCLAFSCLRPDPADRLTFIDISTTSAHTLAVLGIISFICFSCYRSAAEVKSVLTMLYGILAYICLLTTSRGGFIGLICVFFLFILNSYKVNFKLFEMHLNRVIAATLIATCLIYILSINFFSIIEIVLALVGSILNRESSGYAGELRASLWDDYTQVFLDEPKLLLIGNGFPRDRFEGSIENSSLDTIGAAHNYVYGSIALGGILYFIPLLLALFFLVKSSIGTIFQHYQKRNRRLEERGLLKFIISSSIITFLIMAVTDNFSYLFSAWPIQVVIGLLFFCAGFNGQLAPNEISNMILIEENFE